MTIKIPQVLIEELLKRKLISPEQGESFQRQAKEQDKDFGRLLIEQGVIADDQLAKLKGELYKLPVVDFGKVEADRELSKIISAEVTDFYKIIPVEKKESVLRVGVLNPEDLNASEALKFIGQDQGLTLDKQVISYQDFDRILKSYTSITEQVGQIIEPFAAETKKPQLDISGEGSLEQITADSPVTKVVALTVKHAVDSKASDIHIEPFENFIRVRFRIDGVLQTALTLPKNLLSAIVTRIKILSDLKIDETRLPQDGRFSTYLDRKIDFRVSSLPTRNGEKIVMRILDPLVGNIDLPDLGLGGHSLELVLQNLDKPFGQILVTGPTGSGKSTTLYSLLRKYNNEGVNVITLEDPIEYYIDGVNQSQTHEEIGYTFASGLRTILRQDPDVILVGEIRDRETAGLATNAALTGHVVLASLHTNDSVGVIPRLVDMGVEKYLLAPTLNLAIAQRLLRKLCNTCKVKVEPNVGEKKIISDAIKTIPEAYRKELPSEVKYIYKPSESGCKECGGKAYKGRIAIYEVLAMSDELEAIILGDISESKIRAEAKRQNMIVMFQDGIIKVSQGITSLEELLQTAQQMEDEESNKEKEIGNKV